MELNLKSRIKKNLKITLYDGRVCTVLPPGKKLYDTIRTWVNDETDEAAEDAYELVALVLSHNAEHTVVTKEELEEALDYEDLYEVIGYYYAFCEELSKAKNSVSPITQQSRKRTK